MEEERVSEMEIGFTQGLVGMITMQDYPKFLGAVYYGIEYLKQTSKGYRYLLNFISP